MSKAKKKPAKKKPAKKKTTKRKRRRFRAVVRKIARRLCKSAGMLYTRKNLHDLIDDLFS